MFSLIVEVVQIYKFIFNKLTFFNIFFKNSIIQQKDSILVFCCCTDSVGLHYILTIKNSKTAFFYFLPKNIFFYSFIKYIYKRGVFLCFAVLLFKAKKKETEVPFLTKN